MRDALNLREEPPDQGVQEGIAESKCMTAAFGHPQCYVDPLTASSLQAKYLRFGAWYEPV